MRLVVADTGPLNYLVLIEQIDILTTLEKVFVPQIVRDELRHDEAPEGVRRWIAEPPLWIEIVPAGHDSDDPDLLQLDDGERAAIQLAVRIGAELLLMDDRNGVNCRTELGFRRYRNIGHPRPRRPPRPDPIEQCGRTSEEHQLPLSPGSIERITGAALTRREGVKTGNARFGRWCP
jgi:predicted nucleic acid-binding protein